MNNQKTLVHHLLHQARVKPNKPALFDLINGAWQPLSWAEFEEHALDLASGLMELGIRAGDAVAIIGPNRRAWPIVQLGLWSIGVKATPIYATSTDQQVAYILKNSQAKAAVAMSVDGLIKLQRAAKEGELDIQIFTADPASSEDAKGLLSLYEIQAKGQAKGRQEVENEIKKIDHDTVALLIYTSGTTGHPKGVQLDHGNMISVSDCLDDYPEVIEKHGYILLSYLPLSHIVEQVFSIVFSLKAGGEVYFCEDMTKLRDYLPQIRPTVFVGVPRVWEKFQAALESAVSEASSSRQSLFAWARRTELNAQMRLAQGQRVGPSLSRAIAQRLVISKLHNRLGFDRLQLAGAGGAPTNISTLDFFASIGILIHEGFGMTETTGPITLNPYRQARLGTVGQPIRGVQARIADDGEILVKGRPMTRGYFNAEAATKGLLDEDGWLHTGDIGTLDQDGFLKVTGRKKELLITAGGKNVVPNEIEALFNTIEGIGQSVVVGDREPYLVGILAIDHEAIPRICEKLSIATSSPEEVISTPQFQEYLRTEVDKINEQLARYQTIKKYHLVASEFSVDGGELTPSLKLRRTQIVEKYSSAIKSLYEERASA